jgi:membrane dipeptidase
VGLATDYPIDQNFDDFVTANRQQFSPSYTRWGSVQFMTPETLTTVGSALLQRGYPPPAISAITGGNFQRVAEQVWR